MDKERERNLSPNILEVYFGLAAQVNLGILMFEQTAKWMNLLWWMFHTQICEKLF